MKYSENIKDMKKTLAKAIAEKKALQEKVKSAWKVVGKIDNFKEGDYCRVDLRTGDVLQKDLKNPAVISSKEARKKIKDLKTQIAKAKTAEKIARIKASVSVEATKVGRVMAREMAKIQKNQDEKIKIEKRIKQLQAKANKIK